MEFGGEIRYEARVARILTQRTGGTDRAVGVELADGTQEPAEIVISAADGHATLYEMLGGAYLDDELRGVYERDALPLFSPILLVGVGVAREFADEAQRISGLLFPVDEPIGAGTVNTGQLEARIGEAVVRALDRRYPGLKDQVEMVDVATPATTVRYTGNWRASFEGWMPTGVMTAREVLQLVCKRDGVAFRTTTV